MGARQQISRWHPEQAIDEYQVAVLELLRASAKSFLSAHGHDVRLDAPSSKDPFTPDDYRDLLDTVHTAAAQTSEFSSDLVQRSTGFDVDEIRLTSWDKAARPTLEAWERDNVKRIVTVAEEQLDDLADILSSNVAAGGRAEDLAETIATRFGITESQAETICVTETLQLNSTLNTERATDLGIESFIWRCIEPCDICSEYDGQMYSYVDEPEQGMPGFVHPRCKCYADPQTQELL